jgi:hypothetical protein
LCCGPKKLWEICAVAYSPVYFRLKGRYLICRKRSAVAAGTGRSTGLAWLAWQQTVSSPCSSPSSHDLSPSSVLFSTTPERDDSPVCCGASTLSSHQLPRAVPSCRRPCLCWPLERTVQHAPSSSLAYAARRRPCPWRCCSCRCRRPGKQHGATTTIISSSPLP